MFKGLYLNKIHMRASDYCSVRLARNVLQITASGPHRCVKKTLFEQFNSKSNVK